RPRSSSLAFPAARRDRRASPCRTRRGPRSRPWSTHSTSERSKASTEVSRLVGASVLRVEDRRMLTGQARYVADVRLPGMLHAAFVRSAEPHADIVAVDTTDARQAPGVVAVLTGADLRPHAGEMRLSAPEGLMRPAFRALADDRARFVGDPLAIVVAESRAQAEDAADLVVVDLRRRQPVVTIDHALDPARPPLFDEVGTNVLYREAFAYG